MTDAVSVWQQSVEEFVVDQVRALLEPVRAEFPALLARVQGLRTMWGPWLTEAESQPWADWAEVYRLPDCAGAVHAVADRLDGTEAMLARWEDAVAALTPRQAHRYGPGLRLQGLGYLEEPAALVAMLVKVRDQCAYVESVVRRHGPLAPARRAGGFVAKTRREIHGPERGTAQTDFDPLRVARKFDR